MKRSGLHPYRQRSLTGEAAGAHVDEAPDADEFLSDVLRGLSARRKTLPCKYFYDAEGSRLFDEICELDEYYVTRTEVGILEANVAEMAELLGDRCLLFEYGSGSSVKTRLLLDQLESPAGYVPIDISCDHLLATADDLRRAYPEIPILPICSDYTSAVTLPPAAAFARNRALFFPGSTLGNFAPDESIDFLTRMASLVGPGGLVLIGVDLQKDVQVLLDAYDDADGVTAAFNLNLLSRINQELGGNFRLDRFSHEARWNEKRARVEMHLRSEVDQVVQVAGRAFRFVPGETIWTESSHKFTPEAFAATAKKAGFCVDRIWTDSKRYFSIQLLRAVTDGADPEA